ncbi:hypothetical protein BGZ73_004944 [Actinomortierella ambigua]|nr:hypothetical protein BGZ73_004944 [Actinomortierella ambigua]
MEHVESDYSSSIAAAEPMPVAVEETTATTVTTFVSDDAMSSTTASPPSSGRSTPFSTMSDVTTVSHTYSASEDSALDNNKHQHNHGLQRQSSVQNLRDKRANFFNRRDIVVSDTRYISGRNTTNGDYSNVAWSSSASSTFPRIRTDPNSRVRFQSLLAQWKARDIPAATVAVAATAAAEQGEPATA